MVWRSRSQRRGRGSCAGGRQLADPSSALDGELDSLDATQDSVEGTSRKLCERYAKAPVVAQAWLDYFERKQDSTTRPGHHAAALHFPSSCPIYPS